MENKKSAKFKSLVSDKKSDYLSADIDREKRLLRARVVFKILDFINSSNPKITREQFAKKIGVTKQYVSKLLRGNENLTMDTMQKIAHAMEIELYELLQPAPHAVVISDSVQCVSGEYYAERIKEYVRMNSSKIQSNYLAELKYAQEINYATK